MAKTEAVPLVIVGAGPAGLAAGMACLHAGLDFCIFEMGQPIQCRDHENASDLGHGTGGAGLYSDGKFSFYPSATKLWSLNEREDLEISYAWLTEELGKIAVRAPSFPQDRLSEQPKSSPSEAFVEKRYTSVYATLEQRKTLIREMQDLVGTRLSTNTTITQIERNDSGYQLSAVKHNNQQEIQSARSILLATGRFGPLLIQRTPWIPKQFCRLELGIRIEQPSKTFFFAAHPQLDPKYIFSDTDSGVEYRTFCCCRNGEIISIEHDQITAISGRADIVASGRSNVGFHVRIVDEEASLILWPALHQRLRSSRLPVEMPMTALLRTDQPEKTPIGVQLGPELVKLIVKGLRRLVAHVGDSSFVDAIIHSPALEGLNDYPAADCNLRIPGTTIWAAGDVSGRFRGLVAALVSGHFAGLQIVRQFKEAA